MAILIDRTTRVVVQGITGRQGGTSTKLMKDYGTLIVAGVTPGKGGQKVHGVPVFDSIAQAFEAVGPIDASVTFVPAPLAKGAVIDALEAGVKLIVVPVDRMPVHDVIKIVELAESHKATIIGPNSIGMVSPGEALLGMIGGDAEGARRLFHQGSVGIMSRSGGMTTTFAHYLSEAGLGQSTVISVGGDAIIGSSIPELLPIFERDEKTKCVAIFGEIGTTQEERAAEMINRREFTKPLVAYIAGISAPEGTRFSHSAAIVSGTSGSARYKIDRLKEAGAVVVEDIMEIPPAVAEILQSSGGSK
jgi:succinyl-CoA synthetase alpha subunit